MIKLVLRRLNLLAITLFFVLVGPPVHADDASDVGELFNKFKASHYRDQIGEFYDDIDSKSRADYDTLRRLALGISKSRLISAIAAPLRNQSRSFCVGIWDAFAILHIRVKFPADELQKTTAKQIFSEVARFQTSSDVFYQSSGGVRKPVYFGRDNNWGRDTFEVVVDGNQAAVINPETTRSFALLPPLAPKFANNNPFAFAFVREEGQWRFDFSRVNALQNLNFAMRAGMAAMSRPALGKALRNGDNMQISIEIEKFVADSFPSLFNREFSRSIWKTSGTARIETGPNCIQWTESVLNSVVTSPR